MKNIAFFILKTMAKIILRKYQPEIIGITGSFGKTSAKEAIFTVLKNKLNASASRKNYNNELGLPLSILLSSAPGKSLGKWWQIGKKFFQLWVQRDLNYPPLLILEMGVDHPGDMDKLLSVVHPRIGVLTAIGSAHLEFFGQIEKIKEEKQKLLAALPKEGCAVVNFDDELCRLASLESKAVVISYGLHEQAKVQAKEIVYNFGEDNSGISCKVSYNGSEVPLFLPQVIGPGALSAALSAVAVGLSYGLNLVEITNALKDFRLPTGRFQTIKGLNNCVIIDDTYNASPEAVLGALKVMQEFNWPGAKIAILGDMLELGAYSQEGHFLVGKMVASGSLNKLITVGSLSTATHQKAIELGFNSNNVIHFANSLLAAQNIQDLIPAGSLVLIKGSQGARMEKISAALLDPSLDPKNVLARQDESWVK